MKFKAVVLSVVLSMVAVASEASNPTVNGISVAAGSSSQSRSGPFPACNNSNSCPAYYFGDIATNTSRFTVTFSQDVFEEGARAAVSLRRLDNGQLVSGTADMSNGHTLNFRPIGALQDDVRYRLSLDSYIYQGLEGDCRTYEYYQNGVQNGAGDYLITNTREDVNVTGCTREYQAFFRVEFTAQGTPPVLCGNNRHDPGENCSNCPQDWGPCCPNSTCDQAFGETCTNCPQDCNTCPPPCNNNNMCDAGENPATCADCRQNPDCGPVAPNSRGDDARAASAQGTVILANLVLSGPGGPVDTFTMPMRNVGTTTWGAEEACFPPTDDCVPRYRLKAVAVRNVTNPGYSSSTLRFFEDEGILQTVGACDIVNVRARITAGCSQDIANWPAGRSYIFEIDWRLTYYSGQCANRSCSNLQPNPFGSTVTTRVTIDRPFVTTAGMTGPDYDCDNVSDTAEEWFKEETDPIWRIDPADCNYKPIRLKPKPWNGADPQYTVEPDGQFAQDGTIYSHIERRVFGCSEACLGINHLDLWSLDCGSLQHPGDIEGIRQLICAPRGDARGMNTPRELWQMREMQWPRHEQTSCGITDYATDLGAGFPWVQDVWVARHKHGAGINEYAPARSFPPFCQLGPDHFVDDVVQPPPPFHINIGSWYAPLNDCNWIGSQFFPNPEPGFNVVQKRILSQANRFRTDPCRGFRACEIGFLPCDECEEGAEMVIPVTVQRDVVKEGDVVDLDILQDWATNATTFDATDTYPDGMTVQQSGDMSDADDVTAPATIVLHTHIGNTLQVKYRDGDGKIVGCITYAVRASDLPPLDFRFEDIMAGELIQDEKHPAWKLDGTIGGASPGLVVGMLDERTKLVSATGARGHEFRLALPKLAAGGHVIAMKAEIDLQPGLLIVEKKVKMHVTE